MIETRKLSDIKLGVRHRRDLGDLNSLSTSIQDVGLLHPVVIRTDGTLIAGERRWAACKQLGWPEIPVTVIDLDEIVRGEFAENAERKDFISSEVEAIRRAIAPLEREAAKARMSEGGKGAKVSHPSRATDKIGAFAGISGRTVEKIAFVHKAAEQDPERFGDLPAEMDATGKVDRAYSKVRRHTRHKEIANKAMAAPLMTDLGPFPVIYADPPWKWGHFGEEDKENEAGKGRTPDQHYPTLTYDEIKSFRIGDKLVSEIAHRDAALFLWCTSANIALALQVMESWGFTYKAHAVWVKDRTGTGLIFRNQHEPLLYGTRGNMPGPQHQPHSVFNYPRGKHSAKPPEIREIIGKMYPDFDAKTRLELFARETVEGWTPYGFESHSST